MIYCKESYSENIVTDDLGLHRLLLFGNFLLLLVLTFGLKKTVEVDGLILTKLLIFYRTGVSLARCRKSMSFARVNLLALCYYGQMFTGGIVSLQYQVNHLFRIYLLLLDTFFKNFN